MPKHSPINDLDLKQWREYPEILTDSLWIIDKSDRAEANTASYHGLFIPEIPRQSLLRYTRQGEVVLDPFLGLGTTAIEAMTLRRNCIGADLNPQVAEQMAAQVEAHVRSLGDNPRGGLEFQVGNACDANFMYPLIEGGLRKFGQAGLGLAILHPPYHNIIKFSEDARDLSQCNSVDEFLALLGNAIDILSNFLAKGRFLVLVMGDLYVNGEVIPLGAECMHLTLLRDYRLKGTVIKNIANNRAKRQQDNLWRYRALAGGFFIFKHEQIHFFERT